MKIVVLDGYTLNPGDISWNGLEELGELKVYDRTSPEEVITRIGDAEIVYTNKTPITKETLEACNQIKFIGVLATGYNVVDVATAKEKGIPVANIPTYGTDAVGQFAIALLLEICHHIGYHSEVVHKGEWSNNPDWISRQNDGGHWLWKDWSDNWKNCESPGNESSCKRCF